MSNDLLSNFAHLYGIEHHPRQAFWLLYATVVVLSAIVYQLGFAKKLPILKTAIVYALLILGCFILTIFALRFPVVECLMVIAIIFGGYKLRLRRAKKNGQLDQKNGIKGQQ